MENEGCHSISLIMKEIYISQVVARGWGRARSNGCKTVGFKICQGSLYMQKQRKCRESAVLD